MPSQKPTTGTSLKRTAFALMLILIPAAMEPLPALAAGGAPSTEPVTTARHRLETATLSGGCFWSLDAVFERLEGVERVVSGYSGGTLPNPTYGQVCSGTTGHAESIQISFDPAVISYRVLLQVFFGFHDPTTPNRQGADVGTQYRSAIFWHDPGQRAAAEQVIAELKRDRVFDSPIVTEVVRYTGFFPAEDYHQGYYDNNSGLPYCRVVISPKLAKLRKMYANRVKGRSKGR
jgi:peptide-methionine (S)-S-oxide reductase